MKYPAVDIWVSLLVTHNILPRLPLLGSSWCVYSMPSGGELSIGGHSVEVTKWTCLRERKAETQTCSSRTWSVLYLAMNSWSHKFSHGTCRKDWLCFVKVWDLFLVIERDSCHIYPFMCKLYLHSSFRTYLIPVS